jgi:DNA-binding MarR family transcriptional regulator
MPRAKSPVPGAPDLTPVGRLAEAGLHRILGYQLAQATIAATGVFAREVGQPFELRPVEFSILALIDENPGVSAKQLARALALAAPNITVWIDKLERRELIQRERSAVDRRAQHIRTTAKGAALARKAALRLIEGERQCFGALSAAESAMLIELLHKAATCRQR